MKRKLNIISFTVGLLILICKDTPAVKYFVTSVSEFNSALPQVQPGDTIVMKNQIWMNSKIILKKNGTQQKPIYLIAETPGNVILSGASTLRIAGNYLIVDGLFFKNGYSNSGGVIEFKDDQGTQSNYCRLTNTAIVDFNPPRTSTDYKWVSLYGTNNRVDHCFFKGKTNIGATFVVWRSTSNADYHLIDSNYFGQRLPFPENGAETIRVGTSDQSLSSSFTIVEYNYFEDASGEAEIISNKSCDNIYRYNTFVGCAGALTLRHGNRCLVEGNFFFGNKRDDSGGIRIIGEDHKVINNFISDTDGSSMKCALTIMEGVPNSPLNGYYQVKRAVVAFNTLVNNRYNFYIGAPGSGTSLQPLDCTIGNNIILATGSTNPMIKQDNSPINMTYEGNIFYGSSLGITQPTGITIANPMLNKTADGLWRVIATSPAIGTAAGYYPFIVEDMDGQTRINPKDVGADQFSLLPINRKPLTKDDVGPKWMQSPSSVNEIAAVASQFSLEHNFPNPFNPQTNINFSISQSDKVLMNIYDVNGKLIETLVDEELPHGSYQVKWTPKEIASGIYYCRMAAGKYLKSIKLIFLK